MKMIKLTGKLIAGIACGAALAGGLAFAYPDNNNMAAVQASGRLVYKWYTPEMPKSASFAGEAVPLDRWEVRERFDRELLVNYYLHGSLLYILKLSSRYFPLIESRLKSNGIPDDFKYLCVAESSLQHLTSSAGAQSFWQFLGSTAPQYGLEVNGEVDERYNVSKATDAACKYFQQAHDKFGTWTAAAASYNCGMGGYNAQVTYQGSSNYYDLLLPEETNRYVFRILALKQLIANAAAYGYIIQPQDAYQPYKTKQIRVAETIPDLAAWARANGTTYKYVKLLNPWLRGHSLTVKSGKTYGIEVPQ